MSIVHLKKARAGSDSWGHSWPEDGSVVEVDYEQAMALLAIPDGGFSVVDSPDPEPESSDDDKPEGPEEVSEVAPEPEPDATPDEKPTPRRGGRPRKTVEEG